MISIAVIPPPFFSTYLRKASPFSVLGLFLNLLKSVIPSSKTFCFISFSL
jgi:hypothetical protein